VLVKRVEKIDVKPLGRSFEILDLAVRAGGEVTSRGSGLLRKRNMANLADISAGRGIGSRRRAEKDYSLY
jgi:hypothetical protein